MPDRGKFYHPNGLRVKRRHAPLALRRRLRVGIGDWGLGIGGIGIQGIGCDAVAVVISPVPNPQSPIPD